MRSALIALALLLVTAPAAAAAQPGTVDRDFGRNGLVKRAVGGPPAVAGVQVLPGGEIVLIGTVGDDRVVLQHYTPRGLPAGSTTLRFTEGVRLDETLVTSAGKLLLAGSIGTDAAVIQVNRIGQFDQAFGNGGIWRVDLQAEQRALATGLAREPDGRLVVAIDIQHGQRTIGSWDDLAVARLTSAGVADPSFATGGLLRIDAPSAEWYAPTALALDDEGRALVAVMLGYTPKATATGAVIRLTPGGIVDSSYGATLGRGLSGFLVAPGETDVFDVGYDPAGQRALVTGDSFDSLGDGSENYGFLGTVEPGAPQTTLRLLKHGGSGRTLVRDRTGSVLVGGVVGTTAPLIVRATPKLQLDRGFGRDGRALTRGRLRSVGAIALQPDGGILAAGRSERAFRLVRLHGGYDRSGPRVSIRVAGQPCEGRAAIAIRVRDRSPLRRLVIRLDGRRIDTTRRKRVTVAAPPRAGRAGAHKIAARAVDVAGNLGGRSRTFTCHS